MDEHEPSPQFLFDLDPPRSRRQRLLGVIFWLAVVTILAVPLRLLLNDEATATQVTSSPSPSGYAEMCARFALPSVLREFADLAYPIWNNVCDLVGR